MRIFRPARPFRVIRAVPSAIIGRMGCIFIYACSTRRFLLKAIVFNYGIYESLGRKDVLKIAPTKTCKIQNRASLKASIELAFCVAYQRTMSHTISDLRLANKNLESEKASLLTALKLIQGDCTRMTETAHAGKKTTKPNKCNPANYPNDDIEQGCPREVADCTKQRNETPNTNIPLRNRYSALRIEENAIIDGNGHHACQNEHHAGQNEDNATRNRQDKTPNQRKQNVKNGDTNEKITTVIVGDSMVKHLDPKRLKRSIAAGNHNIYVETYRGSNTEAMSHHIRPWVARKPDQIILHVSTNNIRDKQTNEIVNGILEVEEIIKKESPTTNVVIVSHTWRDAKKCLVSKFQPILFKLARVTPLHIIMTYVNDE